MHVSVSDKGNTDYISAVYDPSSDTESHAAEDEAATPHL